MLLYELAASASKLNGVGPAAAADLQQLGVGSIGDLLLLAPRGYEDRKNICPLLPKGQDPTWVNTVAEVTAHDYFSFQGKMTLKIHIRDEHGIGTLVCFGRNFLAGKLLLGQHYFICGSFSVRYGEFQCSAFDSEMYSDDPLHFGKIQGIYPLSGNLQQGKLRRILNQALEKYARNLESSLPSLSDKKLNLLPTREALFQLHQPTSLANAEIARESLAFEELFFLQAGIARSVIERRQDRRPKPERPPGMLQELEKRLPFPLTGDQKKVILEITDDLNSTVPMRRLLHGDVGSGKTLAALSSALPVLEAGGQVVLLVPTALLAQQHARTAAAQLEPLGIRTALLTGSLHGSARKTLLEHIANGEAGFISATHAAFSKDVHYRNLQYVIVDEQHRFGVEQRMQIIRKAESSAGCSPDVLFMTATPIPRTLALTVFGDLQVSAIREMPPGRLPVKTHLARMGNENKVYEWVRSELQAGKQAYFVYPLIRESSKISVRDAESMAERLSAQIFPEFRLGLIHSETPQEQKEQIMKDFASGEIKILAATSVIEVGVDVPNASCMVIEHAERFGLAALHQLRGRVGRGKDQAYCFLVYAEPLTDDAKQRIMVLKEHTDGFRIAEEDLNIRGPGDLAGTRQAGFLRLRIARLPADMELMNLARKSAFEALESDPGLQRQEHDAIRKSLHCMDIQAIEHEGETICE
ncbi:ATP-dependent DNA helicase RecG [Spirochaeta dissipatitropha]